MTSPRHKSRSLRRVYVKTPGGRNTIHYKERKPKQAHCADCGSKLHGIPRKRAFEMKNLPKTQKRPERPFGGKLCSKCTREHFRKELRVEKND